MQLSTDDVTPGAGVRQSVLDPRRTFSCCTVVIRAYTSPLLPALRPQLHEGAAELLYRLAASPLSMEPTLEMLRREGALTAQLDLVCQPLPAQVTVIPSLYPVHLDLYPSSQSIGMACVWGDGPVDGVHHSRSHTNGNTVISLPEVAGSA